MRCDTCKYKVCIHRNDDIGCFDCEHFAGEHLSCKCLLCSELRGNIAPYSYYRGGKSMEDSQIGPKNITARVALYCDECGGEIYEDEEYYYIDSSNICDACIDEHISNCKKIAEVDDE